MTAAPAHARPCWRLEVGSYSEGWAYAIEEGGVVENIGDNLIPNPGAKTSTSGWVSTATLARSTTVGYDDDGTVTSFQLSTAAGSLAGSGYAYPTIPSVPAKPGAYTAECQAIGQGSFQLQLYAYDASTATGTQVAATATTALAAGTWTKLKVTGTLPAGTTGLYTVIRQMTAGAQVAYFDQVRARPAAAVDQVAPPVRLVEPFSFAWRYTKGAYMGQPEPETASFTLSCDGSGAVPDVAQGDQVFVNLYRPQAPGSPERLRVTYFRHDGVLQEPEAVPAKGGGMTLNLVSSDLTADLGERPVSAAAWHGADALTDRLARIAWGAGVNINHTHPAVNQSSPLGYVDNDGGKTALELVKLTLAGALFLGADQLCMRGVRKLPSEVDPTGDGYVGLTPYFPSVPVTYFLQPLRNQVGGGGPYSWTAIGGVLTLLTRALNAAMAEEGRLVLPASAVRVDGTTWRKSRSDATNQVKLTGLLPLTAGAGQATGVAGYPDLIARYGANTRVVDSHNDSDPYSTGENRLPEYAEALLPEYGAAIPKWSLPEFTLYPHLLPDSQLDLVAAKLYPHKVRDINAEMQLAASLLGIAPDWALTGSDVHGVLTGATFQITKGRLSVVGQLNGWKLRPTFGPTWADLRANAKSNAVKWRTGATKLDPALTYEDVRQIGVI